MCVVLLSGFLMLEQGYSLFWLYPVANPIDDPDVNAFFFGVHRVGCLALAALAALVLLHVAAALYHHRIKGDRTLYRMLGPQSGR